MRVSLGQSAMKYVSLADARANMAALLDEVERGETVAINREGRSLKTTEQWDETRREQARQAIRELREMRKTGPRVTVEEILQWRDEGRRY
jgi:prevent-host-death family protein